MKKQIIEDLILAFPQQKNLLEEAVESVIEKNDMVRIVVNNKIMGLCEKGSDFGDLKIKLTKELVERHPGKDFAFILTSQKDAEPKKEKVKPKFVKKIFLVMSGKGGVGKSSVTMILAQLARDLGKKAAILDADIYGPSIAKMTGTGGDAHQEVKPRLEGSMMVPFQSKGVKAISIGHVVSAEKATIWRGPMLSKALKNLFLMTKWGDENDELDVLFVDMPPGTGDVAISILENFEIEGAFIVSTPQEIALADAMKACEMCSKLKVEIVGAIENMSYFLTSEGNKEFLFGKSKFKEFCQKKQINLVAEQPFLAKFAKDLDEGNMEINELKDEFFQKELSKIKKTLENII